MRVQNNGVSRNFVFTAIVTFRGTLAAANEVKKNLSNKFIGARMQLGPVLVVL